MPENYYIILGIPADSTPEDIRCAYRRLAKELHPDHYGDNREPFLKVQEAYAVLSDPARRRAYDKSLRKNRSSSHHPKRPRPQRPYRRGDMEPLIPDQGPAYAGGSSIGASFQGHRPSGESLLERLSGNFAGRARFKREMPENPTVVITLTPAQAASGGRVHLHIPAGRRCPVCNGQGGAGFECFWCRGRGYPAGVRPILISYPPNVADNHRVRISLDSSGIHNLYLTVIFRIGEML